MLCRQTSRMNAELSSGAQEERRRDSRFATSYAGQWSSHVGVGVKPRHLLERNERKGKTVRPWKRRDRQTNGRRTDHGGPDIGQGTRGDVVDATGGGSCCRCRMGEEVASRAAQI